MEVRLLSKNKYNSKVYKRFLFMLLWLLLNACNYGTGTREKIYTPAEFLNDAHNNQSNYSADSAQLLDQLKSELKNHKQSFYSKEYFDSTKLIIDTVIYNSTFDRLAVFILSKNPTYRQLVPDKNHDWYYDATCYLGLKQRDTILLSWIGPNFDNFYDSHELSEMIRDDCFTGFAERSTASDGLYKYNLNDRRFWLGPIWKKNFEGVNE